MTGSLVNVGKDQPGDSIDWERDEDRSDTETEEDTEMEEGVGPQQPEPANSTAPSTRAARPSPSSVPARNRPWTRPLQRQGRQLKAISDACEAWLAWPQRLRLVAE